MRTFIVDAFTTEKFKGNPAGVCLTDQPLTDQQMLSVAGELNLSETAFVTKTDRDGVYKIRYFSPKMEIPLCGHATLASAKVLFEKNDLNDVHFITVQSIDLKVRKSGSGITMEFPVYDVEPAKAPQALVKALGVSEIENCVFNKETNILMIEIANASELIKLSPDYSSLLQSHQSINGVLVTARSDNEKYDFYSRYFWPWAGTNEDPVTGATHTFLTRYWSKKLNKNRMKSFQASARTGHMEVDLVDDKKLQIRSDAVIVFEGELSV